ncbi:MAG: phage holin family protein [Anaerolineales bacterium]
MLKLFIRWFIIAVALVVAVWLIPGITISGTNGWVAVGITAAILGFLNAVIRPILAFFSCGCIVLTMGLFMLVINAAMLSLASWIATDLLGIGFYVDGFWAALFGSIVVSLVSFFLSIFLIDED